MKWRFLALWFSHLFTDVRFKKYTDSVPKISTTFFGSTIGPFVVIVIAAGILKVSIASFHSIGEFSSPFPSLSQPESNLFVWYLFHLNCYLINWLFSCSMIIIYTDALHRVRNTIVNKLTFFLYHHKLTLILWLDVIKRGREKSYKSLKLKHVKLWFSIYVYWL